jgi:hypothetical protein
LAVDGALYLPSENTDRDLRVQRFSECHRILFEIRFVTSMNNEEGAKQVVSDYYNAFSTLDVQSILPYFHQPALLIGPLGVIAIPTPAAVIPIFGPVMEDLRQRRYRRSEWSLQQFKLLSATSALAVGVAMVQG